MPTIEQELWDLFRKRTAVVPAQPDRLASVERRIRRRRRATTYVLAAALLIIAGAGLPVGRALTLALSTGPTTPDVAAPSGPATTPTPGSTSLPTSSPDAENGNQIPASAPPSPTPMVTRQSQAFEGAVDGVRVSTLGPHSLPGGGTASFVVTVILTNDSPVTWRGTVGVGVYGETVVMFGKSVAPDAALRLLYPPDYYPTQDGSPQPDDLWFEVPLGSQRIEGRADPRTYTISPGKTIVVRIGMLRYPYGAPQAEIRGWVPVLNPRSTVVRPTFPDVTALNAVDFE